jgi:hypothetical protein
VLGEEHEYLTFSLSDMEPVEKERGKVDEALDLQSERTRTKREKTPSFC